MRWNSSTLLTHVFSAIQEGERNNINSSVDWTTGAQAKKIMPRKIVRYLHRRAIRCQGWRLEAWWWESWWWNHPFLDTRETLSRRCLKGRCDATKRNSQKINLTHPAPWIGVSFKKNWWKKQLATSTGSRKQSDFWVASNRFFGGEGDMMPMAKKKHKLGDFGGWMFQVARWRPCVSNKMYVCI